MRVEAERFCPAELAVDGARVERRRLPHLELIDRGAGNEVAADKPAGGIRPRARTLLRPDAAPELRRADLGRCRSLSGTAQRTVGAAAKAAAGTRVPRRAASRFIMFLLRTCRPCACGTAGPDAKSSTENSGDSESRDSAASRGAKP